MAGEPMPADGVPGLLYIAGFGRSGSTLLEMLLTATPDFIGVGEVALIYRAIVNDEPCSCGQPIRSCDFWHAVFDAAGQPVTLEHAEHAAAITAQAERFRWTGAADVAVDRYNELWTGLLDAVKTVSGARTIVDSSKSNRLTWRRPMRLHDAGVDVRVIHLVRDPRGVMWSYCRGLNTALEAGREVQVRAPAARAMFGWLLASKLGRTLEDEGRIPLQRVRYEDVVSGDRETIAALTRFTHTDVGGHIERLAAESARPVSHGVGGNRVRRKAGPVSLRLDEEWRALLPRHAHALALVGRPQMRKYGYR